ncbi:acyl-CoA N-acyltransferase [Fomitopsis serialis]|uniref:acyl-CoA N-acyltransferase n=1 Tax=Fomitopsis serialis TaxID=139415 RepID=UPI0020082563|nr:acyl-CoA N-acyltransferase [Neoantrodia serialis]KAH9929471.1 acyl-CoA N-acyltransferase [Neoantrodia serialis]
MSASPIVYRQYTGESDLPHIMSLVQHELSEPYVIYTYRYFLRQWPQLSFLAYPDENSDPVGVIVCKQSMHREARNRGYIAMLSVHRDWRKRGIASTLVRRSLAIMKLQGVEEVVLETEYDNSAALSCMNPSGSYVRSDSSASTSMARCVQIGLVVPPGSEDEQIASTPLPQYHRDLSS